MKYEERRMQLNELYIKHKELNGGSFELPVVDLIIELENIIHKLDTENYLREHGKCDCNGKYDFCPKCGE